VKHGEWTKKIERIIGTIERGETPVAVRELYLFGSYVRGALEPGDLDIVVVHERPSQELLEQYREELFRTRTSWFDDVFEPGFRFQSKMRSALKRRGEKIDLILTVNAEQVRKSVGVPETEFLCVWTHQRRQWRNVLGSIRLDPAAGRAERNQFVSPKRIRSSREAVQHITDMLERKILVVYREPLTGITVQLNSEYQHWLDWSTRCKAIGKQSLKCLPYALHWLQRQRAGEVHINGPELVNTRRTRRVQIGNLHLYEMLWFFENVPTMKQQCLIPHIKRGEANEWFIFERGRICSAVGFSGCLDV
jgi:hypothetical protein